MIIKAFISWGAAGEVLASTGRPTTTDLNHLSSIEWLKYQSERGRYWWQLHIAAKALISFRASISAFAYTNQLLLEINLEIAHTQNILVYIFMLLNFERQLEKLKKYSQLLACKCGANLTWNEFNKWIPFFCLIALYFQMFLKWSSIENVY